MSETRRLRMAMPVVALAAMLTYASSLGNRFAVDDDFVIVGNPRVHQLADQAAIWLTPYWPGYGEQLEIHRPLVIFGYALQWAAAGGAPWVFHTVSVLLHAAVSLLVLALLGRLVAPAAALAGALLFAVHPVHTEAVANVVGQAELLAAAALLGACTLHAGRGSEARVRPARLAAIAALLACGLLAKESAVVLPGLLVIVDIAQRRLQLERDRARAWLRGMAAPIVVLASVIAGWLALRAYVLGATGASNAAPMLPFLSGSGRLPAALSIWPEYMRLLLFPIDLSADYSPGVIVPAATLAPMVMLGALLLVCISALALALPARPDAGMPAAWFLVAILPVSNLLFPIGVLLGERLLYVASVALSLAAASVWTFAARHTAARWRRPCLAAAVAVLAALAARSFVRNPDWRDSAAYYAALNRDHPESYRAQWGNAAGALARGDLEGARNYMELAYRIWPHDPQQLNELALLYIWARQYDRAVPLLERSREIAGFVPRTWVNLAYTYIGVGRHADALDAADSAARLGSNQAEAFALRAQAYEGMGRHADAAAAWTAAVRDPRGRAWTYWTMRARALARLDDQHAALAAADTASTLAPERDAPIVANVRAAIAHGCYAGRPLNGPDAARASNPSAARARSYPADDCRDPLDDWAIVTTVNALPRPAGATARGPVSVRTRAGAGARYASHATVSARTRTPGGPG